jgi:hypothetical protein
VTSQSMTGLNFMVMWLKLFHQTPDRPEPLGKAVDIRLIVDSVQAGCKWTRRSRTGFLIYCNLSLIIWLSKKQPTLETSIIGAEFVAMKLGSKRWEDWDTNYGWWACRWMAPHTSMEITNPMWPILLDQNQPCKRNAIPFAIMQYVNPLLWERLS